MERIKLAIERARAASSSGSALRADQTIGEGVSPVSDPGKDALDDSCYTRTKTSSVEPAHPELNSHTPSGHCERSGAARRAASRQPRDRPNSKKDRHDFPSPGRTYAPGIKFIPLIAAGLVVATASPFALRASSATEPEAELRPNVEPLAAFDEAASALWRKATLILDEAGVLSTFRGESAAGQESGALAERVRAGLADGVPATENGGETVAAVGCAQAEQVTPSAVVIGDTLHLRFFEEPSATESGSAGRSLDLSALVFERLDLSGSYATDERGELSIPLLGRIDAAGRSLACVEQLVADRYRQTFSNTASITASFETRHPVFVSGAVRSPGSYATTPGMTVRHALALAGADTGNGFGANQTISNLTARRFELDRLRDGLDLEISRIQAAVELRTTIEIDPERLIELRSILGERRVASEFAALAATVGSHQIEREDAQAHVEELALRVELLEKQQSVVEAQIDQNRRHLERLQPLNKKGLAPLHQMLSEEQKQMDIERSKFRVSLDLSAAREAYNVARRDLELNASAFKSQLNSELLERAKELNAIEAQIASVDMQIDALTQGGGVLAQSSPNLILIRQSADGLINISADPETTLFPGDILEVGVESVRFEQLAHTPSDTAHLN